ncbi:MAG: TetR/AcrR family transcriptional regulator [Candidatus Cloacimonadales bacterium]|jgi:TetR/AcrR family fatty acid metabolism transcriptional regulator|nr:TetR/AcrR family transcriptional regulator [Candidatus Cloacimonadota bacterium]MDX9978252.1 TetR/AcrR family transcriptional regulator [Candidatus Cloacimonadales bacterium]
MAKKIKKVDQNKAKKKKAIFESAIENFAKNGFHNTSMSDIAKSAGVADGTLYLYYKNKDDLMIKVFNEMVDEKLELIQEAIKDEKNPLEKLYKVFEYHIELFTNNPDYVRFFVQEVRQSPEFYDRFPDFHPINKYLSLLEDLIKECVDKGYMKQIDPVLAAKILYGSIDFILSEWSLRKDNLPLKNIYKNVIDIFHNGMKYE